MNSAFEREPLTGKSGKRGPVTGAVRARIPAKSMNSVFEREPWTGKSGKRGPGAGAVRARLPAKPMNSVFEREPWTGKSGKRGPGAGAVRAHLPAKPMNSVFERDRGTRKTVKRVPPAGGAPPAQQRLKQSGGARRPGGALTNPAESHRPGRRPGRRCSEVKFKLTIQSENLRFNSRCFYHSKACLKW